MYDKNNFSLKTCLTNINSEISPQVLKYLHTNCNKPFITINLLKKFNAVQAQYNNIPVLAFPMYLGDLSFKDYKTWHCIPYMTYPDEPRFLIALNESTKKEKGRPSKNEKKIGLLGIDFFKNNKKEEIEKNKGRPLKNEEPEIIFLTEGEWDMLCLNNYGYPAVGLPGVNNFDDSWLPFFKDKIVYIMLDNDDPGEKYTQVYAKKIYPIAKEVKIIKIPKDIEGQKIKDVCDIALLYFRKKEKVAFDNLNKIKKAFKKIIDEESTQFNITIKDQISEIIQARGNKDTKIDIIINMILENIQRSNGSILAYNNKQELAVIPDGKRILIDEEIIIYLREKYNFYDCDIWRATRDKLHTISIDNEHLGLYYDSAYIDGKIHIGIRGQGILIISKDMVEYKLQGENHIYIKTDWEDINEKK